MDKKSEKEDGHNEAFDSDSIKNLSDLSSMILDKESLPSEISFDVASINTNTTLDIGNLLEQFGNADISQVSGLDISAIKMDTRGDQLLLSKEEDDKDAKNEVVLENCYKQEQRVRPRRNFGICRRKWNM